MNIPRHVAIIMDGNGRWAKQKGLPRVMGHKVGAERVEELIRVAPKYGVRYLTLYAFSQENWQRPEAEVTFLMNLLTDYLEAKLRQMMENNVVFRAIGNLSDMPQKIQSKLGEWTLATQNNTGLVVTFAFSYSSRFEITQACRQIAAKAASGELKPAEITEQTLSRHLYTANLPDPDLLFRTSGEMRISNFLLWQISYTELYVTDRFWPDFTEEEFAKAISDFSRRERRYGRTETQGAAQGP